MKTPRDLDQLLSARNSNIKKLQDIVKAAIQEEELILDNLSNPPREILARGQRLADKVASFGGSWTFIITFLLILAAWVMYNSVADKGERFDPYPFILMNLVLSCIAALQAPVILMSQNRQEEKDRKRAENDYLINLKAELEVRSLHQKMDLLIQEEIRALADMQADQLRLLHAMDKKLGAKD